LIDRRALALAGAAGLLVLTAASGDLSRLPRRAAFLLLRSGRLDSNTRHLNGTVASPDRQFYVFLESARRAVPPGAPGVAVLGAPAPSAEFLVPYQFLPIRASTVKQRVPPGWLLAVYGPSPPGAWNVVAQVWKGVLLAPRP
jgi:hypothetical protein